MKEVYLLCQFFHQDVDILFPDLESVLIAFFATLSQLQLDNLSAYLNIALEKSSDRELATLWIESGSDWYIEESKVRQFLSEVSLKARAYHN